MPVIELEMYIHASIETCFDLARHVDTHTETTKNTQEKAIDGVTSGLMEEGDWVTWEAIHFGIKQQLTAKITEMNKPYQFTDVMVKGAFHSFTHIHEFVRSGSGTIMKDRFAYKSPFGFLGMVADKLFLENYMKKLLKVRAYELKRIAEDQEEWW
ncbi:SRPBCC family protein [Pontibacillus sp. HMF3514]|uniref:SRPBCC family protein n=1 Tax=Pontibacillus sp. HMF3514 TaxID=2692425 RepID=UPI00131FA747|nr:SRPBCC family protein [Pontibacillus sp. HMF3514]QHE51792.1 cell division protein [Pontibacillus sp. HMF3514]